MTQLFSSRVLGSRQPRYADRDLGFALTINAKTPFAIAFFNIWINGTGRGGQEMVAFADLEESFVVAADGQRVPYPIFEAMAGLNFQHSYLARPEDIEEVSSFDLNSFELWLRQQGFGLQYRGHVGYKGKSNRNALAKAEKLATGESVQYLSIWGLTLRIDKSLRQTRCYLYYGFQMEEEEFHHFLYEHPYQVVMVEGMYAGTIIREFENRIIYGNTEWKHVDRLLAQLGITSTLQRYIWPDKRMQDHAEYISEQLKRIA